MTKKAIVWTLTHNTTSTRDTPAAPQSPQPCCAQFVFRAEPFCFMPSKANYTVMLRWCRKSTASATLPCDCV